MKVYIKPVINVIELAPQERLACDSSGSGGCSGCGGWSGWSGWFDWSGWSWGDIWKKIKNWF